MWSLHFFNPVSWVIISVAPFRLRGCKTICVWFISIGRMSYKMFIYRYWLIFFMLFVLQFFSRYCWKSVFISINVYWVVRFSFFRMLRFQAGCYKRRLNLCYNLSWFILCCSFICVWWFVFCWFSRCMLSFALAYIYCIVMFFSPGFNFDFFRTCQEIGCEEHLRCELFSVEWVIEPSISQSINQ